MGFVKDQDRFSSTPKLPLFTYPMNNIAYETPGLATPPVNIAGSVPFQWEEAPGKPLRLKKPARSYQKGGLDELPPRLLESMTVNEPSPRTVLDGPYDLSRRSLSLPRSAAVIRKLRGVSAPAPENEKRLFGGGSSKWGNFGKCKDISEGILDFSRSRDNSCRKNWAGGNGGGGGDFFGDGGSKLKIYKIKRKGNFFNLSSTSKSVFWARVYEGFRQVIPWRRKEENLERTNSSII